MQECEFGLWLESKGLSKHPVSNALSRCRRIENSLSIDLDSEFGKDSGVSLLELLHYSADDEANNRPSPKGIYFEKGANIKNGLASLKNAAKNYFEFCKSRHL